MSSCQGVRAHEEEVVDSVMVLLTVGVKPKVSRWMRSSPVSYHRNRERAMRRVIERVYEDECLQQCRSRKIYVRW